MSEHQTISPDRVLMARLHAACKKSYEARALPLSAGEVDALAHVLETPDNPLPQESRRGPDGYAPEDA